MVATTRSEENYLKAIYHLSQPNNKVVSTNAIAEKIESKASSVTDMLKKLADKHLLTHIKYKGVTLTEKGRAQALNIIRKHRLWEFFLVEKLNFSWDEVHEVAEQLEHIKSPKLIKELDAYLNHPTHDPHGDPIPDETGLFQTSSKIKLAQAEINSTCICVGVKDSSTKFLKYLDKLNIALGTQLKVLEKETFDESMLVLVRNKEIHISKIVSQNLYVKIKL